MLLCVKRIVDGIVRIINFDDYDINRVWMNCLRSEFIVDENCY